MALFSLHDFLMSLRPFLFCAAILAFLPATSRANFLFTVTDLGTLGGSTSHGLAVNDYGQVVGEAMTSAGVYRAFAFWKGTLIDLGTLGGDYSSASGINDNAQIVGTATTAAFKDRAFLFSFATGIMTDLGTLGRDDSRAAAINNSGIIVGDAALPNGSSRAFYYANGVMHDLGTLGGDYSSATAIDDNNVIVGISSTPPNPSEFVNQSGFVFFNGSMVNLSTFGIGGLNDVVYVNGVSDAGIAGDENGDPLGGFGPSGFIIRVDGTTVNFGSTDYVASEDGINEGGLAVGYVQQVLSFTPQFASLYAGGVSYDLNALVDLSGSDFTQLTEAKAISNTGYIVGNGTTKSGAVHAFLLTPIRTP